VKAIRKTIEGSRRSAKRNIKPNDPPFKKFWAGVPVKKVFQRFALIGAKNTRGDLKKAREAYDELLKDFQATMKHFNIR